LMVLIRRLLAKSRDERYASMAEVRADLGRLSTSSVAAVADDRIPLIGREQEFAELKRALEEALAGRGSLVMVGGEPGIGMPELRNMFPDMPAAIQLPPEQQRRFLFNAYRSFVERCARLTPIVAVFEGLHWADEPTLLLLQHLAQTLSTTPMLLIGTYRDVELEVTRP